LFNEDQQQAKQLLLAELEKLENKNGSTKGQHNKSKLMGLKFMQNAEATQKKANKAEVEGLWRALEGHDRSDKTDEGGEEINDSGGTIIRAGRKKEGVVGKPEPNKSEFEEAKHSSEDGGGGDQAEVRIVNKPSSGVLKNPFAQPGVSSLQFPKSESKGWREGMHFVWAFS